MWELDWLANRARLTPANKALIDGETGESWTFSQLEQLTVKTAHWLSSQGIKKGDRIAILSPNDKKYFLLLFGCAKIGAILVPINWRMSISEIQYILQDCMPKIIFYHPSLIEKIYDFTDGETISLEMFDQQIKNENIGNINEIQLAENDPLLIIYTGGTTGKPKGVVLSHQSILWNGINTIVSWNLTNEDRTVTYMPLFHTGGLNALSIPILLAGGTVIIGKDYEPKEVIRLLNEYECTIILLVPTMYQMLIETNGFSEENFPSVKVFLSGGAPCPLTIYEAFEKKGIHFKEGYGLTEAGPNNFYIDPNEAKKKKGSVGKPMMFNMIKILKEDGTEAEIDEVGEIVIQGKHTFEYYWKNDEATNEAWKDGWLYTGDLAKKDKDGFYYIVGRKKDMIITGGENVYPLEIEHWLDSHPNVEEAAVVGLPHKKWGELVTAFVVLNKTSITEDELKTFCSLKLGKYKIPKKFIFLHELPKTHVGKIDKKALKQLGMNRLQNQ